MSLINQMLKDLEYRSEGPVLEQQDVLKGLGSTAAPVQQARIQDRKNWLILLLLVISLSLLVERNLPETRKSMSEPELLATTQTSVSDSKQAAVAVAEAQPAQTGLPAWQDNREELVYEPLPPAVAVEDVRSTTEPRPAPEEKPEPIRPQSLDKLVQTDTTGDIGSKADHVFLKAQAGMHWDSLAKGSEKPETNTVPVVEPGPEITALETGSSTDSDAVTVMAERPEAAIPNGHFERNTSPPSRQMLAKEHYQKALVQMRQRKHQQALDSLQVALNLQPSLVDARLLLATSLLANGQRQEGERLLIEGLQNNPAESRLRYAYAQVLAEQGKLRGALALLSRQAPTVHDYPDYHALMAALYQREGDHQRAIGKYSEVLKIHPDKGLWWMGLGISSQASGDQQTAMQAFQTALRDRSLTQAIRQYLTDRLHDLRGATG